MNSGLCFCTSWVSFVPFSLSLIFLTCFNKSVISCEMEVLNWLFWPNLAAFSSSTLAQDFVESNGSVFLADKECVKFENFDFFSSILRRGLTTAKLLGKDLNGLLSIFSFSFFEVLTLEGLASSLSSSSDKFSSNCSFLLSMLVKVMII
ncbi:unnamed protein product [Moneuplotes crassus]|uniref:Uncharacterized protein n=1 Tax=Euplotes crassus TaxID=5936 RepID=A0AAD1U192_EUPCR|nr:unnamed protein product [Moneuplotes crassus]